MIQYFLDMTNGLTKISDVKKHFNRFLVKDFVKSVKGTEFPKFFDVSITQEEFDNWMEVFYKYRGDLLTGGICMKEFLSLKFYGERPNEYRVFYANGEIVSISKNSGQENFTQEPPKELVEKYKNLPSIYYTVDFAELVDGTWKVIEAGDGSDGQYEVVGDSLWESIEICMGVANSSHGGEILWIKNE